MNSLEFNYVAFYKEFIETDCYMSPEHFAKLEELPIIKQAELEVQDITADKIIDTTIHKEVNCNFLDKSILFDKKDRTIKEHMQDIIESNDNKKGKALWEEIKVTKILY